MEQGPKPRYDFFRVNPSNGGSIWSRHQDNLRLVRAEAIDKWILMHFDGKTLVMKCSSL